ncbi:hypothetical protein E3V39_09605 [Gammaproteobacteria bacterium LSUCC0112]|nr:hypothetical protein E3V39_09605 [Gammaproteobacteria bacterium LSUCC0112]
MNNSQLHRSLKALRLPAILLAISAAVSACITAEEALQRQAGRMPTPAEVEQYNASVAPEERIVCRNEIPVGSNIPVRKCRLMNDIDETSTFHREQLRRALR